MVVAAALKKLLMDAPRTVIPTMQTIVIRAMNRAYSTIETPLWSRPNSLTILMIRFKGVLRNDERRGRSRSSLRDAIRTAEASSGPGRPAIRSWSKSR